METEEEQKKDIIDLLPSVVYPRMFRLVYEDGSISKDFYNKTRAKEIRQISLNTKKNRK